MHIAENKMDAKAKFTALILLILFAAAAKNIIYPTCTNSPSYLSEIPHSADKWYLEKIVDMTMKNTNAAGKKNTGCLTHEKLIFSDVVKK